MLIARRGPGVPHCGRWELPGGKARAGETLQECLERELEEELGIRAAAGEILATSRERQGDREIELHALRIVRFSGEPCPSEHDRLLWAAPQEWRSYEFLEPDRRILVQLEARWPEIGARWEEIADV